MSLASWSCRDHEAVRPLRLGEPEGGNPGTTLGWSIDVWYPIVAAYATPRMFGGEFATGWTRLRRRADPGHDLWAVVLVFVRQTRVNTANYSLASSNLAELGASVLRIRVPRVVWLLLTAVASSQRRPAGSLQAEAQRPPLDRVALLTGYVPRGVNLQDPLTDVRAVLLTRAAAARSGPIEHRSTQQSAALPQHPTNSRPFGRHSLADLGPMRPRRRPGVVSRDSFQSGHRPDGSLQPLALFHVEVIVVADRRPPRDPMGILGRRHVRHNLHEHAAVGADELIAVHAHGRGSAPDSPKLNCETRVGDTGIDPVTSSV